MSKYLNKRTGIIGALAIGVLAIILVVSTQLSSGLTLDEAKNIAKAHIPAGAGFLTSEDDGGDIEVVFYDSTARETYSIEVSKETKTVTEIDRELDNDAGSKTVKLKESQIKGIAHKNFPNITDENIVLVMDDGLYLYEVSFSGKDFRGEISINPETGVITESSIKFGTKVTIPNDETNKNGLITTDEAKDIAIKSQDGGKVVDIDLDKEKGQYYYEVTVLKGTKKIELLINAKTKAVTVEKSKVIEAVSGATSEDSGKSDITGSTDSSNNNNIISLDKAKSIVLAKIPGANIVKIKLDKDDGMMVYEGKALLDKYEYEFEINASSGVITDWDKDIQDKYDNDDDDDYDDKDDDDDDDDDYDDDDDRK